MNEHFASHAYTLYFFTVTHCLNNLKYSIDQIDSPNKGVTFFCYVTHVCGIISLLFTVLCVYIFIYYIHS
jgi:hypothetical protein